MKDQLLPQRAYTAIMKHFIKTGFAPHYSELAQTLNVGWFTQEGAGLSYDERSLADPAPATEPGM